MTAILRPPAAPRRPTRAALIATTGVAVLLGSVVGVVAASAAVPTTLLVSVKSSGAGGGNAYSSTAAISANGRYVLFISAASDLVTNDGNGKTDVFVRDTRNLTAALVSVDAAGDGGANGDSSGGDMSPDGRYVMFTSTATDLVSTPVTGAGDLYVRDLEKKRTVLVSVNASGTAGANGPTQGGRITPNGRFVVFASHATDLVAVPVGDQGDVYVRDLKKGTTTLVTVNLSGNHGGDSVEGGYAISADGRYVTFDGNAGDLVANDGNGTQDVFVRDLRRKTTTLVSVDAAGTAAGVGVFSFGGQMSRDGRFVFFNSDASNLVAGDGNGKTDVFVRDLRKRTTTLVSVNAAGTGPGNDGSSGPAISSDGRHVAFTSLASDLVANDGNGKRDAFVRDLRRKRTELVSVDATGAAAGDGSTYLFGISADGRYASLFSDATDLVATTDANATYDVFVRDLKRGITTLASANLAGTGAGDAMSYNAALSRDGRSIAFDSGAIDLVANDGNGKADVFVRRIR